MAAPAIARPMLASLADAPLDDPAFVYEPKYDGIRAVAEIAAHGGPVRLWSRLGNDKAAQFPGIVAALRHWAASPSHEPPRTTWPKRRLSGMLTGWRVGMVSDILE